MLPFIKIKLIQAPQNHILEMEKSHFKVVLILIIWKIFWEI